VSDAFPPAATGASPGLSNEDLEGGKMYVPTPGYVPPASPHARELGHKIQQVVIEYQQTHPGMGQHEVQQAIKMAEMNTGGGRRMQALTLVALGLTLLAVLGTLAFWRMAAG
jgi:hypothetical protein